jgi:hypothetical protein
MVRQRNRNIDYVIAAVAHPAQRTNGSGGHGIRALV